MGTQIGYTTASEVERLRAGKTAVVQGEPSDFCTVAVRLGDDDAIGAGVKALETGETYYDKGKDAAHFERLNNKDFAWALTCAAQDLNDSSENVSGWMPVTALLDGAAERIKALGKALDPFANVARAFEVAIGPDGIDDALTVEARISARPEHEAVLSTEDFSRARACLSTHTAAGAGPAADEEVLPCDVMVAPRTLFRKGVKLSTMLAGLRLRASWPEVGRIEPAAVPAGAGPVGEAVAFEFDRYIDGTLMAEGVKIERQTTLEKASMCAAQIASRGPNGEVPVLVLRSPVTARPVDEPGEVERLVEETGSSSVNDIRDMALVGHSLMEVIGIVTADGPYKDWTPAENPTEIVADLINDLEAAHAKSADLDETYIRCETAEAALAETREENARLNTCMLIFGAYLMEKGEAFRTGEGAELLDAYSAALSTQESIAALADGKTEQELIDAGLTAEFENDLRDMTDEQIAEQIRETQDIIDEHQPWLEALCVRQRQRAALAGDVKEVGR